MHTRWRPTARMCCGDAQFHLNALQQVGFERTDALRIEVTDACFENGRCGA